MQEKTDSSVDRFKHDLAEIRRSSKPASNLNYLQVAVYNDLYSSDNGNLTGPGMDYVPSQMSEFKVTNDQNSIRNATKLS